MKLISLFKTPIIEFLCDEVDLGNIPEPVWAGKRMPQWFKDIRPVAANGLRDEIGAAAMSAKKCMPLQDAMSLGFIIPLWADLNVRTDADGKFIEFAKHNHIGEIASFHSSSQVEGIGKMSPTGGHPALKFINRIVVKTAPGYSALFIPPIGHIEPRFTCLPGLVDTDLYPKQVNFPAIWHAKGHDAILPAGTPLVTCIPVRRKDIVRDASMRALTDLEAKQIDDIARRQLSRRHVYTDELRESRK